MHDDPNVPPLSDDAANFLREHANTGEPSAQELVQLRAKLMTPPSAKVVALPVKPRRSLLPPEVMAVAALLVLAVAAQVTYLAFRPELVTGGEDAELARVVTAYRTGGLDEARLAASSCTSAACATMSAKLLRALELSGRFEKLDDGEVDELTRLDVELSGGVETELTRALEERRKKVSLSADALLGSARELVEARQLEAALGQLSRCLTVEPGHRACAELEKTVVEKQNGEVERMVNVVKALRTGREIDAAAAKARECTVTAPRAATCYRLLGSALAAVGARDQSEVAIEEAKRAYARYLELAPADDEYVPKVKAILAQVEDAPTGEPSLAEQYRRATEFIESEQPAQAKALLMAIIQKAPSDPLATDARRKLLELAAAKPREPSDAKRLYLRGYMLKESEPDEAMRLFKQVMDMTPPDDVNHQKAAHRIEMLEWELRHRAQPAVIKLKVGESARRTYGALSRVAVGDSSVADVRTVGNDTIEFIGVAEGSTVVVLWLANDRLSQAIEVSR